MRRSPWIILSAVFAFSCSSCSDEPEAEAQSSEHVAAAPMVQDNVLGFEVWHGDFPFPVHLSPVAEGAAYHYTSAEALERVVKKLMGNCTSEGWSMALEFFNRAPESAVPLLVESMDEALQAHELSDLVQNTAEAMGRMGRYNRPEIAEALLRALQHGKESVQNGAMAALVPSGTPETVREARRYVPRMHVRGQADWVRAVRRHLPEDEIEDVYLELFHNPDMTKVFGIVVEESAKLPLPLAARVLGSLWQEARGQLRFTIASTLHAAGDLRGTRYLREVLEQGEGEGVAAAIVAASLGDLEYLRDDILKLSLSDNQTVRQAVALTIGDWPGDNVDNILSTLAVDPSDKVRHTALTMLRGRGKRELLERLIERVETSSGTKLVQALGDLSAAGDGLAAQPILARMRTAPPEEWRKYLQALGLSRTEEGFLALREVFLEPEVRIDPQADRSSVTYIAIVLANIQTAHQQMLELFGQLPREDYRRRASLMFALSGIASTTENAAASKVIYDFFRTVLHDPAEVPQVRLLALEYLRRDLTLDDMKAIKKLHQAEAGPMRQALSDFLFEFF